MNVARLVYVIYQGSIKRENKASTLKSIPLCLLFFDTGFNRNSRSTGLKQNLNKTKRSVINLKRGKETQGSDFS